MKTDTKKKVLIALDYDSTSQKVAEAGYSMAEAMKAEVFLLHIIADATYYSALEYSPITGFAGNMDMSNLQLNSIDALKNATRQFLEKTKHHLGDKTITILVKEGDFADSILATAKEILADFIVIGSHSRNWIENMLMGSVTEKVLRHSKIPVLIISTKKPV
jgi:nucleotide-binding universal stress UspA family protein